MTERLRFVREQCADVALELKQLRATTLSRDAVTIASRAMLDAMAKEIGNLLDRAPRLVLQGEPAAGIDALRFAIRRLLQQMSGDAEGHT